MTRALTTIINQPLSANTVRLHLKNAGMKVVVKSKCPILSTRHHKACLDFAYAHKDWTVDDWKKVIWSDETKINHLGSDGCKWVRKKTGEGLSDRLVEETLKFGGGSVMMWGCMTWQVVGFATKIDGRMDSDLYLQILKDELYQTLDYYSLHSPDVIFQQDNDPKHTCKKVKAWLEEQELRTMRWPAQSPDLNPLNMAGVFSRGLQSMNTPLKGS